LSAYVDKAADLSTRANMSVMIAKCARPTTVKSRSVDAASRSGLSDVATERRSESPAIGPNTHATSFKHTR